MSGVATLLRQDGAVIVQVPAPPAPPIPEIPPAPEIPFDVITDGGQMLGPPEWVGMVAVLVPAIIGATIVLFPLARAWARRLDRGTVAPPLSSPDVTHRLERIENAVEAMAVEVERISEGQRFLTRVMSDLRSLPAEHAHQEHAHAKPERLGAGILPPSERRR